jgi:ligand-binding sensor domain-containing protein
MSIMRKFQLTAALAFAAGFILVGCSSDDQDATQRPAMQQMAEAVAESVVTNIAEAAIAKAEQPAVPEQAETSPSDAPAAAGRPHNQASHSGQLVTIGNQLYSVSGDRLVIYDWVAKTYRTVTAPGRINAIAAHAEKLYVGGEGLFVLEDTTLVPVDSTIEGTITSLLSFTYRLLVGTDKGIYSRSIFGNELLLDGVVVSDLAADDDGVWVGTDGSGLFRWDGVDFKARFLSRDQSLMEFVTALDYGKNHLYVGTPNGMYIFDGGRWETITTANGLPSNYITAIDASYWVVAIGTDAGVTSYFNGDFLPVASLDTVTAEALGRYDGNLVVQTDDQKLLVKSGPAVRQLMTDTNAAPNLFTGLSR